MIKHILLFFMIALPGMAQTNEDRTKLPDGYTLIYDGEQFGYIVEPQGSLTMIKQGRDIDRMISNAWDMVDFQRRQPQERFIIGWMTTNENGTANIRFIDGRTFRKYNVVVEPERTNAIASTNWLGTIEVQTGVRTNVVQIIKSQRPDLYGDFVETRLTPITERYRIGTREGAVVVEKDEQ
jgi:hypothetical protein